MKQFAKFIGKKIGLAPGSLVHIGEKMAEKVGIRVMDFNEKDLEELQPAKIEDAFKYKDSKNVSWINVDGLHDTTIIEKIGAHFDIHPLVMEDILNTNQRPKYEDHEDYLFIVVKMISYNDKLKDIESEQVSMILTRKYLITFQEKYGDVFDEVRERIRKSKGRIRKMETDFLAYSLLDAIIDSYYKTLERIAEKVELLEEEVMNHPSPDTLKGIHRLKNSMIQLRRSVWPLREVANNLVKTDSKIISDSADIFMRDFYDHTVRVTDSIDTFRDMLSGLMDVYLSSISNKLNEVMKVLTIFAAIFIPLTFIVGVYGMNFEYMPELKWRLGYPIIWVILISVSVGMLFFFKKRKWL